jgi:hypothetical protein
MGKEELLAEIEKSGGKIEPVRKVCQFQSSVHDNLYSYCKQIKDKNRDYMAFMGLSGGLGAYCWGGSIPQVIDGQIHYKDVPPCPYRGDDRILGWEITIPADD